ncbi:hypothetical protein BDF19DRAFT_441339 [Syncephalis fuscata]|nr:hypothetical protein BDF19DRAFT_441339 [Syncephalis fuscata]
MASLYTVYPTLAAASDKHPKPATTVFAYGTAGFRMKADLLDSVIFRAGVLAALRSKKLSGQCIGVMITASHNPARDNGIKLVDPMGEMLEQSWEAYATQLANASTTDEFTSAVEQIIQVTRVDLSQPSRVIYARDTRPSGPALVAALVDGLVALEVQHTDYGVLSTPQLHYLVRCINTSNTNDAYGEPTEAGYYAKLSKAFVKLVEGKRRLPSFQVDCANGVGAPKLRELAQAIGETHIDVSVVNDHIDAAERLNDQCGADYMQLNQRYASLDGDADRIVYYYKGEDGVFHLLDGDKISGLAAMFFKDLIQSANLDNIQVGVQVPVSCVQTGVKHLHHEAEKYDIGVYFEANGHGTVLFSPVALHAIHNTQGERPTQVLAIEQLRALTELINQTVGDALSDLLLVETILTHKQWTPAQWDHAYTDLPSRLVRVVVKNRGIFETTNADQQLTSPANLQALIDATVAKFTLGRSFVRPSGTEDVVRVYAEAATRHECDELAFRVAGIVFDNGGGVGERPAEFL